MVSIVYNRCLDASVEQDSSDVLCARDESMFYALDPEVIAPDTSK
jgi:hypothetical protein